MKKSLGIIPIKIRAKEPSSIDMSDVTIEDINIIGNIKDASGGKFIALDIYIEDAGGDYISYKGVTFLDEYGIVEIIAYHSTNSKACNIEITPDAFNVTII